MAAAKSRMKRFRNWLVYQVARFLLAVGRIIPQWLGHILGTLFGWLAYCFAGRLRRQALRNLTTGLGQEKSERELKRLARRMFIHLGRILFEVLKIPCLTIEKVKKKIVIEDMDLVLKSIKEGRGVVIATGHIGNWEIMGAAAALLGIPVNVIVRRINDPRLNDLVTKLRRSTNINPILRESANSAKQILRALKRAEMLALLIDQDIKADGAFVPFFGRLAYTPIGAAALAQRTGALFAAAAVQRTGIGKHLIRVKEIEISDSGDREHDIIKATAAATAQFEAWIRECPEQWSWIHDRWHTRPESEEPES